MLFEYDHFLELLNLHEKLSGKLDLSGREARLATVHTLAAEVSLLDGASELESLCFERTVWSAAATPRLGTERGATHRTAKPGS